MKINRLFISVFVLGVLFSCKSDLEQAKSSLDGHWNVESIVSYYPSVDGNQRVDQQTTGLGYFNFSKGEVTYEFTRNDTVYAATTTWKLTSKKENAGFTKVVKFTLEIGTGEIYECMFGDQTKNSERKASKVTLTTTSLVDFNGENSHELHLVQD